MEIQNASSSIKRRKRKSDPYPLSEPSDNTNTCEKSQLIVIRRKRQRDTENSNQEPPDTTHFHSAIQFKKTYSNTTTNPQNSDFNFDHQLIVDQLNRIDIKDKLPTRNLKLFSDNNLLSTTFNSNKRTNLFKNFFPCDIPPHYSSQIKEEILLNNLDMVSQSLSNCKQLKFLERRNLMSKEVEREFSDLIKKSYVKFFGEIQVVKSGKDCVVIKPSSHVNKSDMENILGEDRRNLTYELLEIDKKWNNITEDDLKRYIDDVELVNENENEMNQDDQEDNEEYDSNREDDSKNDYPDEDEDYEYYYTNKNRNTKYEHMETILRAERRLNKNDCMDDSLSNEEDFKEEEDI